MSALVFLRGGGDLASGVALRLHRAGLRLLVTELPQPLAVRRLVSFSEAVYRGEIEVEGVLGRRVDELDQALACLDEGVIPVRVDPPCQSLQEYGRRFAPPHRAIKILVDGRMTKRPPELGLEAADLVIGLGPGFSAGQNCHAVIETNRGHNLGRVIWDGAAEADTGVPERVLQHDYDRVLRAPAGGVLEVQAEIGEQITAGQVVAQVAGQPVRAAFDGVLRGILHPGLEVRPGMKIGDIDPRGDPGHCRSVSDKALAVGGGVLEAILSVPELRPHLWDRDAAG